MSAPAPPISESSAWPPSSVSPPQCGLTQLCSQELRELPDCSNFFRRTSLPFYDANTIRAEVFIVEESCQFLVNARNARQPGKWETEKKSFLGMTFRRCEVEKNRFGVLCRGTGFGMTRKIDKLGDYTDQKIPVFKTLSHHPQGTTSCRNFLRTAIACTAFFWPTFVLRLKVFVR